MLAKKGRFYLVGRKYSLKTGISLGGGESPQGNRIKMQSDNREEMKWGVTDIENNLTILLDILLQAGLKVYG